MTTAVVHIFEDTGALTGGHGTTRTDVDATTVKFGGADAVDASGTPIAQPQSTGNAYSYGKWFYLDVTVAATTSSNLLNRTIRFDSSPTGLKYYWKAVNSGSYVQSVAAADVTNASANGTAPAGFTALTASAASYDSTTASSTATGQNGSYVECAAGVDASYAAGGGLSASTIITVGYDEQ